MPCAVCSDALFADFAHPASPAWTRFSVLLAIARASWQVGQLGVHTATDPSQWPADWHVRVVLPDVCV